MTRAEVAATLAKVKAIAALSDYPDNHTFRGACLLGDEYTLTFGDLRAIEAALSLPADQGAVERVLRRLRLPPFVVFDGQDEVYLAAEKWSEDLWDARQFYDFETAAAEAERHGGGALGIGAESYCRHDRPGEVRSIIEAALSALPRDLDGGAEEGE